MLTLDDLFLLGRLARAWGRLAVLVGRCARSAAQQQLALPGLPKDENVPRLQPQRVLHVRSQLTTSTNECQNEHGQAFGKCHWAAVFCLNIEGQTVAGTLQC